jgi:hypothetical protein
MTARIVNYIGWTIVIAASGYFVFNNALHYFAFNKTQYEGFWPIHAPWLLVHIVGGLTALLLGPFQFIPSVRKTYPGAHRTMGKIYLCAIAVAGLASFDLSIEKLIIREKAIIFGAGLAMLGVAWLTTSAMAYWAVRCKNFVQHREWMVRSFVVTCAFTTFRLAGMLLTEIFHTDPYISVQLMAWVCWSVPLMITEVFLQAGKIRKANAALSKKKNGGW